MAMTLRLTVDEDESLARLARTMRVSKNLAAAKAIDAVAPKRDHTEFVAARTDRLLHQYSALFARLAED
jgi:predicted transcriptional regulator